MKLSQLNEFRSCTAYWLSCCRTDFTVLIKCNKLLSHEPHRDAFPHFPNRMNFGWGGQGWGVTLEFITCHLTSNRRPSRCWITRTDFSPHKNIQVQREQVRGVRNLPARVSLNSKAWDFVFRNYNDRTGGKHPKTHTHKELLFSVKPMHTKKKKKKKDALNL